MMDEVIKIDLKSEGRSVIKTGMSVKAALIFLLLVCSSLLGGIMAGFCYSAGDRDCVVQYIV
jgi:hypothetical protein